MKKILLYFKIREFYKLFAEVVGENFITKLSDVTQDNVRDVLFDINEVFDAYDNDNTDNLTKWINKFRTQVIKFCGTEQHTFGYTLLRICLAICYYDKHKNNGQFSICGELVAKLGQWLCEKGVI